MIRETAPHRLEPWSAQLAYELGLSHGVTTAEAGFGLGDVAQWAHGVDDGTPGRSVIEQRVRHMVDELRFEAGWAEMADALYEVEMPVADDVGQNVADVDRGTLEQLARFLEAEGVPAAEAHLEELQGQLRLIHTRLAELEAEGGG